MKQYILKIIKSSFTIIATVTVIIFWSAASYFIVDIGKNLLYSSDDNQNTTTTEAISDQTSDDCNVYGINLHGDIVTYISPESLNDNEKLAVDETSADVVNRIVNDAGKDDNIKYVVVEIDSSGGSPAAGLEMMNAFKNSKKPVIAFARNRALSAAYLAAIGAQTIFASPFSDIGSIGVTMSYLENTEKDKKEGLKYIDLSSGKYKDTFNPSRPLSNDEKQLIMRDVNSMYEQFVKLVAENRKLDINKVHSFADGSTMLGDSALKNGLVDKLGDLHDVEQFLKEKIGSDAHICWQN